VKRPVSIGDVFQVSVDNDHVAYGQVLGFVGERPFVGVFTTLYPRTETVEVNKIVSDELAIACVIMPTILTASEWPTVGIALVTPARFAPAYKMGIGTTEFPYEIISFDGLPKRRARPDEQEGRPGYPTRSAAHIQAALRVFHNLDQPFPGYDSFLASKLRHDADVAGTTALRFGTRDLVTPRPRPPEQIVSIRIPLDEEHFGSTDFRAYARRVTDQLVLALERARAGGFAGEGFGFGGFNLELAGGSADAMLRILLPLLRAMELPKGVSVLARYGELDDSSAREERINLDSPS
jgi:hypothetical protein